MSASPVVLKVYDISKGMAANMSQIFLGRRIEGVWHTGIVVYGNEYFYGGGIVNLPSGQFETEFQMQPNRTIQLGTTTKTQNEFAEFLTTIDAKYAQENYDLIHHNCNHFTDDCAKFLMKTGIGEEFTKQHETIKSAPMGETILKLIDGVQSQLRQHTPQNVPSTAGNTSRSAVDPQRLEQLRAIVGGGATDEELKRFLIDAGHDVHVAVNMFFDSQGR
eukprot:Selendium_serpulae@DN4296_c0_g1_i1.p2